MKTLESYAGKYEAGPGRILVITTENGKLLGGPAGQPPNELAPLSETRFNIAPGRGDVSFVKDATGKVTELILHQGARDTPAKRLP